MLGATDLDSTPYARAGNGLDPVKTCDAERDRVARTGRFAPGNKVWEQRSSAGPKPKFAYAESLWKACVEYFDWVNKHPLYEMQLVTWKGRATQVPVRKMRAMTKGGLCRFLSIERSTWRSWKRAPGPAAHDRTCRGCDLGLELRGRGGRAPRRRDGHPPPRSRPQDPA